MNPVPKPFHKKKISKVATWTKARGGLVKEFAKMGITSCEIKLHRCTGNQFLGFAHTVKRRNVTDIKRVVLACVNCHSMIEYAPIRWTGKPMEEYLEGIIKARIRI
jgi:hypothetical protein